VCSNRENHATLVVVDATNKANDVQYVLHFRFTLKNGLCVCLSWLI